MADVHVIDYTMEQALENESRIVELLANFDVLNKSWAIQMDMNEELERRVAQLEEEIKKNGVKGK